MMWPTNGPFHLLVFFTTALRFSLQLQWYIWYGWQDKDTQTCMRGCRCWCSEPKQAISLILPCISRYESGCLSWRLYISTDLVRWTVITRDWGGNDIRNFPRPFAATVRVRLPVPASVYSMLSFRSSIRDSVSVRLENRFPAFLPTGGDRGAASSSGPGPAHPRIPVDQLATSLVLPGNISGANYPLRTNF